jgi:hypothetical protein
MTSTFEKESHLDAYKVENCLLDKAADNNETLRSRHTRESGYPVFYDCMKSPDSRFRGNDGVIIRVLPFCVNNASILWSRQNHDVE